MDIIENSQPTWYFPFHLYSNCRMLCIIPANSEFRAKLMMAARGRCSALNEDIYGKTLREIACLLLELSCNHRIGSGLCLSDDGKAGRIGVYMSKPSALGGRVACVAENGLKSTNANVASVIKTVVRHGGILLGVSSPCNMNL